MIQFNINLDGKWNVTKRVAKHNHPLCGTNEQHLLSSHRKVSTEDLLFVTELRDAEVRVADAFCVLKKQAGGASCVSFQLKDLYNRIDDYDKKSFDGNDANSLIEIF